MPSRRATSSGGRNRLSTPLSRISTPKKSRSPEVGRRAFEACAAYGRAVGHPADFNFGDCFAYACAKELGVGLIYKGHDFAHTDLA